MHDREAVRQMRKLTPLKEMGAALTDWEFTQEVPESLASVIETYMQRRDDLDAALHIFDTMDPLIGDSDAGIANAAICMTNLSRNLIKTREAAKKASEVFDAYLRDTKQ